MAAKFLNEMINRENKFNDEPVTPLSVASFYIEIATALGIKNYTEQWMGLPSLACQVVPCLIETQQGKAETSPYLCLPFKVSSLKLSIWLTFYRSILFDGYPD